MTKFTELQISKIIVSTYYQKLYDTLKSDILIIGAGPAGLTAGYFLAKAGKSVTIIEKKLAPGGGVWGGGMGLNEIVIQESALEILEQLDINYRETGENSLFVTNSVELASGLTFKALQAGAKIFNLLTLEDICVKNNKLIGAVINRTMISGNLHVDPITFYASAVIDGTGHDIELVKHLLRRALLSESIRKKFPCEGPMEAYEAERFTVEHTGEIYPGLWVSGMSVPSAYGGPRMGPIFGGMLLSGKKVAELILKKPVNKV